MSLVVRGEYPSNVFQLLGNDENSASYALGWTLDRCSIFLNTFACQIVGRQARDVTKRRLQEAETG
jgi:hypothetical protein